MANEKKQDTTHKSGKISKEEKPVAKASKKPVAGMPSSVAQAQGLSTNDINVGKDTGSWFMNENGDVDTSRTTKEMVKDYNEEKGYEQPEPLEGASGTIARGNQGDNNLAYNNYEEKFMPTNGEDQIISIFGDDKGETKSIAPKPEDTAEVTERHKEELAQLQNAIGDTNVATGTISNKTPIAEEAATGTISNKAPTAEEAATGSEGENNLKKAELKKAPEEANLDFSDYIKNYYGPKNGADYLKALWSQGAGGKAAAIGNVLGNILGNLGTINVGGASTGGRDFHSDWEDYRNNYTKAMAERNQQAFDQNMGIANQIRTNEVARNELLKAIENYKNIGEKMTPEDFEKIRKAMTATGNSSQLDYYLASVLGNLTSDPDFMKQIENTGGNLVSLINGITQLANNTVIKPVNFGAGLINKGIQKVTGGSGM